MAKVPRLLERIKPEHYQLALDVRLAEFRYRATEIVTFRLIRPGKSLTFHAVDLKITAALLDSDHQASKIGFDREAQTVTFEFDHAVAAGQHRLNIDYTGIINESLHGFYRSNYRYQDTEHWLALTQFEAVHAREGFICIDEPAAKAVFELSLTVEPHETAISNTNVVRELTLESGRKRYDFAPTPKMSTYLVAYVIGEFESREATTKEGVLVRVFATAGKRSQLDFALDVGARTLSFFHHYFGIAYPLPKLDMIAIPDFAAGAMENWGVVTYRETALLLDEANASLGNRQRVAEVVAHELAHQWFGNLVTMEWWNDLWLNEGFASWIEVLAQDHLFPEWEVWTQFTAGHFTTAMELDGLANTHPIEVAVEDPRHLDEIFDVVSYSKGAAVINMLHQYLGAETFRRGLHDYLERHSYANSVTADLWTALGKASGKPVNELMTAWTTQSGYPIISMTGSSISQRRFYASPAEGANSTDDTWPIPLSYLIGSKTLTPELMTGATGPVPEALAQADWVKPNAGQTGFFRVLYDETLLHGLLPQLTAQKLPTADRYGVTSDVFAATEAGLSSSQRALELTQALRQETDYVVWSALAGGFAQLLHVVADEPLRQQLSRLGLWLVTPNVTRLGWEAIPNEPYFDALLRPLILQQAIRYDDEAAIAAARDAFTRHLAGDLAPADLRPAVYLGIARSGGADEFEQLLNLYRQETVPQERMRLLGGLCRFRSPELVARVLELGFSSEVRPQDLIFVLAWTLTNREGRELAWQTIQDRWPRLLELYSGGGHMLEHIPVYLGMAFADRQHANEVGTFFAAHPHPSLTRPVAQAVETINLGAAWYERDQDEIAAFIIGAKLD